MTNMTNCPLRHCLPFFLVVIEPPHFQLGTSAQGRLPFMVSLATKCSHMAKGR